MNIPTVPAFPDGTVESASFGPDFAGAHPVWGTPKRFPPLKRKRRIRRKLEKKKTGVWVILPYDYGKGDDR